MVRRARRPEARPDEILDAALDVFSELGFSGARVEDIAARAGLSKGAIYLYFPSKQAMLEALVRRLADRVVGAAENLVATDGADADKLLRKVLGFVVVQISNPKVSAAPRIVLAEAQRFPDIAVMYRELVISRGRRVIAGLCRRGVEQGVFRDVDPEILLRAAVGPILAHMFLSTIFFDPEKPGPAPETVAQGLADILLIGLKVRSADTP
jgi:AcrR family transcriptional regulator